MNPSKLAVKETRFDVPQTRSRAHSKGYGMRKGSRATPALKAATEKRTLVKPLVIKGISQGKMLTVTPSMYKLLDLEPYYQRGETLMINKIGRAVDAGGLVLDPITLCRRKDTGDTLWIVDGHQRACALMERKLPITAIVHESESKEAEADLFTILNSRLNVAPNVLVKSSNTKVGKMVKDAEASLEHPLSKRISFEHLGGNESRFDASTVARGIACALGIHTSMAVPELLSRLDAEILANPSQKERVEKYLRLLGQVASYGDKFVKLPYLVMRAIGVVAHKRWDRKIAIPDNRTISRLNRKDWSASVMLIQKYFPILVAEVEKIWKE